jgi:hypothetical protein
MRNIFRFSSILALLFATGAFARAEAQTSIDIPLVELPYNVQHAIRAPGMQQSLALTGDFYEYMHSALGRVAPRHKTWRNVGITLADYFTIAVPFGDAWLHEEWHRAILGNNDINSKNDVWNLKNLFAESISVSHVTDEDLTAFKRDRPADFVRTKSAGIEAENELLTNLESRQFFNHSKTFHEGLYWLIALGDQLYVGSARPQDSAEVDNDTDEMNAKEKNIAVRDISGHDFTAWVYDLFRPNEPFTARGIHPSGVGINRYIKFADLTPEEKRYIEREGKLMWLNFIDPAFIGKEIALNGGTAHANVFVRHMLTSFGDATQGHVLYEQGNTRLHIAALRYSNHDRAFPGLQAELVDYPVTLGTSELEVSPRLSAWMQPKHQQFMTRSSQTGGSIGIRVGTLSTGRLHYYIDGELKSAGWIAGRPSLERGGTFRAGLTFNMGRPQ